MAGIGFLLKKLIHEDRYTSDLKANLYSLVISSGPWVFAVVCIASLSVFSNDYMARGDIFLFRVIIIYVYAFSLISTSIFQLILTRYISDKLYQKEYGSLLPNFTGAMALSGLVNFVIAVLFIAWKPLSFSLKAMIVILFCTVGFQWIVMVFLSTIRDYIKVTMSFFGGFLFSFTAALFFGYYAGVTGYLLGFTLGQILTLILLNTRLTREFPLGKDKSFEYIRYFNKFPTLAWAALIYNLGFWIDKIIVWQSPQGYSIAGAFRAHYPYDSASFLAALTIIPALSIFFLHVETDFYQGLRSYINVILNKGTFEVIEAQRKNLVASLRKELINITKVQLLITLIIMLVAPNIMEALGFNKDEITSTFMLLLVGFFFLVMFLTLIILAWYLELLKESLYCIILFAALNTGLNYYLVYYAPDITLGLGFLLATMISAIATMFLLFRRLKHLNYLTFMKTPLYESQQEMPSFS